MPIDLRLNWSAPVAFEESRSFPAIPGIYAIVASTNAGYSMARIGAAHSLASRPSNYDPTPFLLEPRLMVSYSIVPDDFRAAMADLIRRRFPDRVDDIDWLEYRMEHLAIRTYRNIWGRLPPGNYQEGSKREYVDFIQLNDGGYAKMLSIPPALLRNKVLAALKQSTKKAER